MASFNKVILIGNMTADPELKQTASGISVCSFSIAVNRRVGRQQEAGQQTVDFINIVAWRERAEFVSRYFTKGKPILVCGQLQTRRYTDNQGQNRTVVEVQADEISFVSEAPQNGQTARPQQTTAYTPEAYGTPAFNGGSTTSFEEITNDEDLPF